MVPRRRAQPRLEPVALPLSAGSLPVRGSAPGERPPGQARSRVRAPGHRSLRRRPLLDRRGALRQGRSRGRADVGPGDQRRPGHGHPARAAHRLVPQHLVLGRRQPSARARGDRGRLGRGAPPVPRRARAAGRPGPGRRPAGRAVLRERDQRRAPVRRPVHHAVPQGRDQRPRPVRRAHRQSRPARDEVRVLVPADGAGGRHRRAAAAAASGGLPGRAGHGTGTGLRRRARPAPRRGRRVLRRADARDRLVRRGAGDAPGLRRDAVEQAALLLRRGALARRRPDPAAAAGVPAGRPQRPVAWFRRVRHHVDAGQMGVSLVRRLGSGVPLRRRWPMSTRRSPSTS